MGEVVENIAGKAIPIAPSDLLIYREQMSFATFCFSIKLKTYCAVKVSYFSSLSLENRERKEMKNKRKRKKDD